MIEEINASAQAFYMKSSDLVEFLDDSALIKLHKFFARFYNINIDNFMDTIRLRIFYDLNPIMIDRQVSFTFYNTISAYLVYMFYPSIKAPRYAFNKFR